MNREYDVPVDYSGMEEEERIAYDNRMEQLLHSTIRRVRDQDIIDKQLFIETIIPAYYTTNGVTKTWGVYINAFLYVNNHVSYVDIWWPAVSQNGMATLSTKWYIRPALRLEKNDWYMYKDRVEMLWANFGESDEGETPTLLEPRLSRVVVFGVGGSDSDRAYLQKNNFSSRLKWRVRLQSDPKFQTFWKNERFDSIKDYTPTYHFIVYSNNGPAFWDSGEQVKMSRMNPNTRELREEIGIYRPEEDVEQRLRYRPEGFLPLHPVTKITGKSPFLRQ